jgi:hypothetical protein
MKKHSGGSVSEENKAIAREVTLAQNENDIEKLRAYLSPDFKSHIADWPEPLNRDSISKESRCRIGLFQV